MASDPMKVLQGQLRKMALWAESGVGASVALRSATLIAEREIKLMLSKPGSGRSYRRGKTVHVASAPGQPPAVDTGTLRASVGHEFVSPVLAKVGAGAEYAPGLEFGTIKSGGYTKPRPFMRPAMTIAKKKMSGVVVGDLKGGPDKAAKT